MSPHPLQLRQQNTNVSFTESFAPERPTVLFQDTGSSLVPFRYSALKQPDSVRLLKLEPSATGADVLSCSFLDVTLSAIPEYEVLSGFWGHEGSPFRPVSLLADGQSCKTTAELAQALFRFRRRDGPRVMWIQSLCVNSDDTGERSGQIERLRHTLLSARRLIVWLGPAQDNSELVFEHVRGLEHLRGVYEYPPSWQLVSGFRRAAPFGRAVATVPDRLQVYPADADAAFRKLCARAWFYRSWSIPELALSKDIILVCGDHELGQQVSHINPLSWLCRLSPPRRQALLSNGASFYEELYIPVLDAVGHVSTLCFDHLLPGRTISIGEAYRIVRNCRATDPRDNVFAIAALEPVSPVEVDYGLSVSEVYQQATFALLSQDRPIQVLRRLASPSGRRNHELPSWTLDFSSPLETASALWALPGPRGLLQGRPHFDQEKADADRRGLWPADSRVPPPRHERRTNTLILTGLLMETIAAIGPAMHAAVAATAAAIAEAETATTTYAGSKDDDDDVHVRFSQILHDWETLAVSHLLHDDDPSSPSNSTTTTNNGGRRRFPQPVSDAFLDTLIAHDAHDVLRNNPPRPPVSSEADRGRRWYNACARRGCGIATAVLSAAEPEYFALRGGADGEKEYCLPAGPWWGLTDRSIAADEAYRHDSAAGEGAFGRRVARACADKRFFVTDKGSMGLAPAGAREGDALAFFPTGQFPMVLRPCSGQDKAGDGGNDDAGGRYWRLVGEGFLYDWWRHLLPIFEHFNKRLGYTYLLTEFAIQ